VIAITPLLDFPQVQHLITGVEMKIARLQYIELVPLRYGKVVGVGGVVKCRRILVEIAFKVDDLLTIYMPFWVPAKLVCKTPQIQERLQEAQMEEPPAYDGAVTPLPIYEL
jgi:hypothetical protein